MRSITIPGAQEGDSLPSGQHVVNFWDHRFLDADHMLAQQPPQKVRFPRLSEDGVSIAGQGQDSGTWSWDGSGWMDVGPCTGTSPVIFDRNGVLHVVRPGPDVTSQGYRCLSSDGVPMLGDHTMVVDVAGRLLHEYTPLDTDLGRILIGQDHEAGVHLVAQGVRRWLTDHLGNRIDGDTHFVRARVSGSTLSVTVSRFDQRAVIHVWMDLSEIALLPAVAAPQPKPDPLPPPKPPFVPPPFVDPPSLPPIEEPTVSVPNRFDIVQAVRAERPGSLKGEAAGGQFTEAVAVRLHQADARFGHLRKNPGQRQFNGHAVDAVLDLTTGRAIDIIIGSKTDNPEIGWGVEEEARYSAADWMQPQGEVPAQQPPTPTPQPSPEVPTWQVIIDKLDAFEARIALVEQRPVVDLSGVAKPGDSVTVQATIAIPRALQFLVGQKEINVTGKGTID